MYHEEEYITGNLLSAGEMQELIGLICLSDGSDILIAPAEGDEAAVYFVLQDEKGRIDGKFVF